MVWKIEFEKNALNELNKLDRQVARRILSFLLDRVSKLEDPRSIGEALTGNDFAGYWKYRVGDYRIISNIEDAKLCILVLRLGNRREVYRQ